MQKETKFDTNSPETKEQAETLLKDYYKKNAGKENLPKRGILESWKLHEDGVMIVVDGASGRKLVFEPKDYQSADKAEDLAEDAEQAALDAEAEVEEARRTVKRAEEKAKAAKLRATEESKKAKAVAAVMKKPFQYIDDEVEKEKKGK